MVTNKEKDLLAIRKLEMEASSTIPKTDHALSFHLMPPTGWLNDPNGLCQLHGTYHIFFQYSPHEVHGGSKYWGHYQTKDFIHYEYTGILLSPDHELDRDGVYSGCALTENGQMYLYYTGNTIDDGEHDLVYEGRGANTMLVTSRDGIRASEKICLLTNQDYPDILTCHVRDPKVFSADGSYYMVLGSRTKDDFGCILLYRSDDKLHWEMERLFMTEKPFGFMWECPDLYPLDGTWILSFSPQGLPARKYTFQNDQQSGYIILGKHLAADNESILSKEQTAYAYPTSIIQNPSARFIEWDMGFDFYAPQAFEDESGRRILIAWMGLSDKAYGNPTVSDGWQHTLTIPRQLTLSPDGQRILQQPLPEMEALRRCSIPLHHVHNTEYPPFSDNIDAGINSGDSASKTGYNNDNNNACGTADAADNSADSNNTDNSTGNNAGDTPNTQVLETEGSFELLLSCPEAASFSVCLDKGLVFRFDHNTACCCLSFLPDHLCSANDAKGYGRTRRLAKLNKGDYIRNARIFVDHSSIEIFLNDGMLVFSSRYYKQGHDHKVILRGMLRAWAYSLRGFEVSKSDEPL